MSDSPCKCYPWDGIHAVDCPESVHNDTQKPAHEVAATLKHTRSLREYDDTTFAEDKAAKERQKMREKK